MILTVRFPSYQTAEAAQSHKLVAAPYGRDHKGLLGYNMKPSVTVLAHVHGHTHTHTHSKHADVAAPCRARRSCRANGGRGNHSEEDEAFD